MSALLKAKSKIKVMRTCSEDKDDFSLAVFSYGSGDVRTGPEKIRTVLNRSGSKKDTFRIKNTLFS